MLDLAQPIKFVRLYLGLLDEDDGESETIMLELEGTMQRLSASHQRNPRLCEKRQSSGDELQLDVHYTCACDMTEVMAADGTW